MNTTFLDTNLPLRGASHADAIRYSVDIPMRYAECCVTLRDGSTARLRNPQQFIGWSGVNGSRRLLFHTPSGRVLLSSEHQLRDAQESSLLAGMHKFVAPDGSLKFVRQENHLC